MDDEDVVRDGREIVDNIVASLNQHASSSPLHEAEWDEILGADRTSPSSSRSAAMRTGTSSSSHRHDSPGLSLRHASPSSSPRFQGRPRPAIRSSSGASVGSGGAQASGITIGERSSSLIPTSSRSRQQNPTDIAWRNHDDTSESSARQDSVNVGDE
jgi:hypothetical protein